MEREFSIFLLSSIFLLRFCSSFTLSTANRLGNETDRVALFAFKSQITLDPSQVLNSWNESNHFCEWEGVQCGYKHQRVTKLDLRSRGLVGSISPHIGNLSFLRRLDLRNNSFQGEIPAKLDQLSRLEYLLLFNNSLVGEIPVNISYCSNLKYIHLYYNNLVGNIPTGVGSLRKLIELHLSTNQLTGEIPPSIGNITSLEYFRLDQNHLDGIIPSTLGQLKNLIFLALGDNKLSGIVPPSLYNLSNLELFHVVINNLTGKLPVDIGVALPHLKEIGIGGNQFFGSIPSSLFNASKLEKIALAESNFTGKVPLEVGNLKNLQWLNLGRNSLGSGKTGDLDFVTSLTNCSNLEILAMSYNHFGGTLPTSIGNFSKLLSILLIGANRITGNIPPEIGNLQKLSRIALAFNFLTGSIPLSFWNMRNLEMLYLYSNKLSGHISSTQNSSNLFDLRLDNNLLEGTISPLLENRILQNVNISYNRFSGTIPKEIGQSPRLLSLDLSHNLLNGSIPLEVGNLKNLFAFAVSQNNLSGEFPNTIVSCSSLQTLSLDGNSFSGPLPSSMNSLVDLRLLDISHNRFSGNIPKELNKLSSLESLNMSFNDFEGEVPILGIFLNATAFSIFGNPKVCGGISKLHLPRCPIQRYKKRQHGLLLKVAPGVLLPLLMMVMFLVFYLRRKSQSNVASHQSDLDHERVSFIDLHRATNGFSSENLIGTGRYGFVYKGINRQGELIAVKVLNLTEKGALKTFLAECEALKVIRHRNLLKIVTVCSSVDFHGNDFKALVYEFMHNGSLDSWLHWGTEMESKASYLTLQQRLNIAIDIASALDYLHNHCGDPVIHCDLKPGNVLLGDDLTAHVGDFGLAKFLSLTSSSSATDTSSISIRGTIGYIPPEYGAGAKVSTEGDVYSFGILLLEMFTGKRPTDPIFKDGLTLHEYIQLALPERVMEIIDVNVLSEFHEKTSATIEQLKESLLSIVRIGVACSMNLTTERMSIKTAVKELNSIKRNFS
ncbi:non-specific serine/threonine protein kinase [Ranunculus cassubicifolius]